MNKKIMSLALALIGLASCNNEEIISKGVTEVLPDGYSGISIKLATTRDADTRAIGDTLKVLTDKEKEIKSIAFFVDNVDGFKSYFSDTNEPTKKLDIPLTGSDGIYTASIRVTGTVFGASEVVLIANYAENGLDLTTITSMAELKAKTLSITNNAATPLLMYSSKDVTLKNGERIDESFDMTRMVGRIDIINLAQKTPTDEGFELTSARLVNAKTQAYLAKGASTANVLALPVDDAKAFSPRDVQKNATNQQVVDTLYTYENPNTEAATATAIELIGTFKNAPVVKLVKFEKFNSTTKKYEPIAIQRNYRYLVEITPAKDDRNVELTIKVKDWDAADTIKVEAKKEKPTINDFALASGGAAKITTWQSKTVRGININEASVTTDQILTFTTTEQQECAVEVAPVKGNNSVNPVLLKVEKITSYADAADPTGKVKTEFTVTIPKYDTTNPDKNVGLRTFLLKVKNSIDGTKYDSIFVVQRIPYIDAKAPAGCVVKNIVWAPMNCGATEYDVKTTIVAGDLTAKHGKLYQWGRKYGFLNTNNSAITVGDTANVAKIGWPTESDCNTIENVASDWYKKLIIVGTTAKHGFNSKNNWLRINPGSDNPDGADMLNDAWYQRLWNENEVASANATIISNPKKTTADPCPEGWRVPTRYEWETIGAGTTAGTFDTATKFYKITADALETPLFLPAAGNRLNDGSSLNQGNYGNYWTSSALAGNVGASNVFFNNSTLGRSENGRADSGSVRCVQE